MSDNVGAALGSALNDLLHEDFDGVPSNEQIALALDRIALSGLLPVRHAIVLDAVARALTGRTSDGWRIERLVGPRKGHRRTKQQGKEVRETGQFVADQLASGICYDSAVTDARDKGHKSASEAYGRHKNRLAIFMDARSAHENRVEQLKGIIREATPKV